MMAYSGAVSQPSAAALTISAGPPCCAMARVNNSSFHIFSRRSIAIEQARSSTTKKATQRQKCRSRESLIRLTKRTRKGCAQRVGVVIGSCHSFPFSSPGYRKSYGRTRQPPQQQQLARAQVEPFAGSERASRGREKSSVS